MAARANISRGYLLRLGMVAFFGLGLALWCIYDGVVTYPKQRERALAWDEIYDPTRPGDSEEMGKEWEALARKRGWPIEKPEMKTKYDIGGQFIMAGMIAPVGLLFLFLVLRAWKRWIEIDESGVRTSWGQQVNFDQITTLDKAKWKAKGIAKIHYEADGRQKRLVLDDCKYDYQPTEEILRGVESHLDVNQIVGGPPQPPPEEEAPPEQDTPASEESAEEHDDADAAARQESS